MQACNISGIVNNSYIVEQCAIANQFVWYSNNVVNTSLAAFAIVLSSVTLIGSLIFYKVNLSKTQYAILQWLSLVMICFCVEFFMYPYERQNTFVCLYKLFAQYFAGTAVSSWIFILSYNFMHTVRNPFEKHWTWARFLVSHAIVWLSSAALFILALSAREP